MFVVIEVCIEKYGNVWVKVILEKFGIEEYYEYGKKFFIIGLIYFKVNYFIYLIDIFFGMNMKDVVEMGCLYGGIRVYRNGFCVFFYGEEVNDWLRLDIDVVCWYFLFLVNNWNFFG